MTKMSPEEVERRHKAYDEAMAAREFTPGKRQESYAPGTPVKVTICGKTEDGVHVRDVQCTLGPCLRVVKVGREQMTLGCSQVEKA